MSASLEVFQSVILAASDSDGDSKGLLAVLLLAGPVFYLIMYLRYRNADKRHHHESETEATKIDVRASDEKIKTLKGLSNSSMKGANNKDVRGSFNKYGKWLKF